MSSDLAPKPLKIYYAPTIKPAHQKKAVSIEIDPEKKDGIQGKVFFQMPDDFTFDDLKSYAEQLDQSSSSVFLNWHRFDPGKDSKKPLYALSFRFVKEGENKIDIIEDILKPFEKLGIVESPNRWRQVSQEALASQEEVPTVRSR